VVVDRLPVGKERQHGPEDVPVAHAVEVLGLEKVRNAHDGGRVLQHRAEHGFLRLQAMWRQAQVALFRARLSSQALEVGVQSFDSHLSLEHAHRRDLVRTGSGAADGADFDSDVGRNGAVQTRGDLVRTDLTDRIRDLEITPLDRGADLALNRRGDVGRGD
jgi:hypothetical protein